MSLSVAVLIPCYNEEVAIGSVVADFRRALPGARIYVCDNNSKDRTVEVARAAGAEIRHETLQGKGNVVRRLFADVEADIYVLVDGDATYEAEAAPRLIQRLVEGHLDMVNASRVDDEVAAYRAGHRFGNWMLTTLVGELFGKRFEDILSGYRVFSRRFVKSFPALASGFEIETELTVHALELRMPIAEMETRYKSRPEGSESKLSTFKDGWRILITIGNLMKQERPLLFFGIAAGIFMLLAVLVALPVFKTYLATGQVETALASAILATGLALLGFLSSTCGFILETVTRGRREMKRMAYLAIQFPDVREQVSDKGTFMSPLPVGGLR
jgi:glycosyltransferase involved in cell wall biosynthesis